MKAPTDPLTLTPEQEALHIASLLYGYIWESLTPDEHDELDNWVGESDENMYLFEELTDERNIKKALDWLSETDGITMSKKLKGSIRFTESGARVRIIRQVRKHAMAIAIAASAILVISASVFFIYTTNQHKKTFASLTNTVSAPRGDNTPITLPDGSKVWLNAATTIHYPPAFSGDERRISINGEAYFEVSHVLSASGKQVPFFVDMEDKGISAEVLGTHFSIKAYPDEPVVKATLVEGSIRIISEKEAKLVKPGEQAQVGTDQKITLTEVNTNDAIAWKNGDFTRNTDIASFMREIGRWYNVEVTFAPGTPLPTKNIGIVAMSRSTSLNEVLKVLETVNSIHTKGDGKRLTVSF